ncbi:MAG: phosphoglycolate phosphatase [Rhizobiales bacterium]|nr:phosphoglycolate phosphatase [Hyphomicrobiales bacterium]
MPDRAVILDLDGTLAETAPDLMEATNHVLRLHGRAAITPEQVRAFIGHGARALIARGFEATGEPVPEGAMEALYERFVAYYAANIARGSSLFPGARAFLERCRKEGIALGVCTNKLENLSVQLLKALDAAHYFGAIVGPDTIGIAKPDPAPYRETLRRLGGTHLRSVMVGDSETDIKTARAAGVPAIGVTFGYTPRPVADFGPDRLISHFDDLWTAIVEFLDH